MGGNARTVPQETRVAAAQGGSNFAATLESEIARRPSLLPCRERMFVYTTSLGFLSLSQHCFRSSRNPQLPLWLAGQGWRMQELSLKALVVIRGVGSSIAPEMQ